MKLYVKERSTKKGSPYGVDFDPVTGLAQVFSVLPIGSSLYYLVKTINPKDVAPNPYPMHGVRWVHESIPKKNDLRGYTWTTSSWVEEVQYFEDNEDAETTVLRQFDEDILKF